MTTKFEFIRGLLGLTQAQIAKELGMSQSNISMLEKRGQTVRPDVARRLIAIAASRGVSLTYDAIYSETMMSRTDAVQQSPTLGGEA